jgi:hypothetical protein
MKIVTADTGGEIDFRVEGLRKMYAKEIAQVDKLTEMAQQIEALQKKGDEANDFMEIHIANERLALHQKERIYEEQFEQQLGPIKRVYDEYKSRTNAGIERHFQFSLRTLPLPLPSDFPWSTFYDPSQRLLQINQRVPFIPDILVKRPESKRHRSACSSQRYFR